ncbi:histidine kinase [Larkinella arboricola]|uniref:Histidine kinase n=1 Tax=Larkinella arboricola TaxID=643671 RepID=A0A327X8Q5_LARAB|nr:histidine kinase [Larkinella arboricola]RAK02273.1 histidine kinase [Larkinella arboricola]
MLAIRRNYLIFIGQFALLLLLFQFEAWKASPAHRWVQAGLMGAAFVSLIWVNYRYLIYPYLLAGRYGAYLARIPLFLLLLVVFLLFGIAWTDGEARDLPTYLRHITSLDYYRSQWQDFVKSVLESSGGRVYFVLVGQFLLTSLLALVYVFFEIRVRRLAIQRENRQAELLALQAQMSPHFFFNALNTVYGQALVEGFNELAERIQELATRAREMNKSSVADVETDPKPDARRTARLTAFLIAGANFLYYTLDHFNFYSYFTRQTVWEFLWYKILANPAGAFFRSLVFALLTWGHYRYLYRPYFLAKRYGPYLIGMGLLLAVHWTLALARMFFSIYLHLHDFPQQGFDYVDLKAWGLRQDATGLQIWESVWTMNGKGTISMLVLFGLIYFLSGWLYQTIQGLVENRALQRQQQRADYHQQADAQNLTAQLQQVVDSSELPAQSAAAQSLKQVTDLMKYVTQSGSRGQVAVADELQFVQDYVAFQRKRIPDHPLILIDFQIRYDGKPAQIVPMLLIPFVENAFQYGIRTDGPCFVDLQLDVEKQKLNMTVLNSLIPKTVFRQSSGIGLANVRKRLALLYPNQYTLTTGETDGVFRVELNLQLSA